jgi:acyl-CoA reductase-like NAD-dependent aldehyde dehydrogenase
MSSSATQEGAFTEPTPLEEVDLLIERLHDNRERWVGIGLPARISILKQCAALLDDISEDWAAATCRKRGLDVTNHEAGEPWLSEIVPTMRSIRLLIESLEANGKPRLPKVTTRPNGQKVATIFPADKFDRLFFTGVRADVWIEEGKDATQGALYRDKKAGKIHDGAVSLVLGAGNVGSICPTDVLYKLFCDDEVVIIKTNPVNAYLGPFWEHMLKPLIDQGFAAIVHGGAEVGIHLCNHPRVKSIHITGSDKTYDAIVWGPDKEKAAKRKAAGDRQNDRPVSAELGCITPVFVVPGVWSKKEMEYQAANIVSMITNNGSFNCVAAKALVTASGWAQRDAFLEIFRKRLAAAPARKAYYPGAEERYAEFVAKYPDADVVGATGKGVVPWTILPRVAASQGEYALTNEAFCGVVAQVDLDADNARDFLREATQFGNDDVWGTLSCSIIIDSKTARENAEELDYAVANLRYGSIGVNIWSGVVFGFASPPWGAAPGHTPEDIQSGAGFVHNTFMLDHPQKTVLWAPFRIRPMPSWFDGSKNAADVGRRLVAFERKPGIFTAPGVILAALKG